SVLPPARILSFTAQPSTIKAGEHAQLVWNVHNADSVSIDNNIGGVTGEGTKDVAPTETTTYKLTATSGGHEVNASTTVTVTGAAPPP
ncbi:MAG: OmpA family protein, partial [Chloroflexi bacterium]|nr:OmpA family protein [Chloroflexota bacterium]